MGSKLVTAILNCSPFKEKNSSKKDVSHESIKKYSKKELLEKYYNFTKKSKLNPAPIGNPSSESFISSMTYQATHSICRINSNNLQKKEETISTKKIIKTQITPIKNGDNKGDKNIIDTMIDTKHQNDNYSQKKENVPTKKIITPITPINNDDNNGDNMIDTMIDSKHENDNDSQKKENIPIKNGGDNMIESMIDGKHQNDKNNINTNNEIIIEKRLNVIAADTNSGDDSNDDESYHDDNDDDDQESDYDQLQLYQQNNDDNDDDDSISSEESFIVITI